jgi:hypothetical protein
MAYTNINKPSEYFNTKLYTGNGTAKSITGVGFQPDWVWIKDRDNANSHRLIDGVRGATKIIYSNSTAIEDTDVNSLTSFTADGFDIGSDSGMNGSGFNFVSWNWLASNTTASNTDGSITSTVSANTTSGFSIVSYTGNGSAATVGHGLGVTPKMFIIKNRDDGTQFWPVYHASLSGADQYLVLDQTSSAQPGSAIFNSTHPTSSVFSVGGHGTTNASGDTLIAYCFAEKKGFSKFGSYVGNGNADGTFIYTGMKPSFVILKRTDSSGFQWVLSDGVRDPDNAVEKYVHPSTSDAEQSGSRDIDFLSNGFKIRNSNTTWNASGGSYIYMCFAAAPLVGTNNIPTTAR